jgi:hypothetical protein
MYGHVEIRTFIRAFYTTFVNCITWPTIDKWFSKRGNWNKLYLAVGAKDGTSHKLLRPMDKPQHQFYS